MQALVEAVAPGEGEAVKAIDASGTATTPFSLPRWPTLFPTSLHAALSDLPADELPGGLSLALSRCF